jgi:hypothetical protein
VKDFSRLPAERMDRLELALELDLGRTSRGCLRRGWTGWNWLWSWIWEGLLEAACEEHGQDGLVSGAGLGQEFSRLPAKRMERLRQALELDQGKDSRGWLRRASRGWDRIRTGTFRIRFGAGSYSIAPDMSGPGSWPKSDRIGSDTAQYPFNQHRIRTGTARV